MSADEYIAKTLARNPKLKRADRISITMDSFLELLRHAHDAGYRDAIEERVNASQSVFDSIFGPK
ncbi:MAG: hypothetical protein WCK90_00550 [archaeon]